MRTFIASNEGFADDKENLAPLKNFHMLVPALTTAFIEHTVIGRAKLKQNDIQNAFISDDGFAMGVAFLLRILRIHDEFNSLNWFDSIEIKLNKDLEMAKKKQEKAAQMQKIRNQDNIYKDEDDEVEEQQSVRKTESEKQEYALLKYVLNASAILFKEI